MEDEFFEEMRSEIFAALSRGHTLNNLKVSSTFRKTD